MHQIKSELKNEINKLIPSVATGNQFNSALGNPQKIFQRIMISTIGGVITLLISQSQVTSQFYSLWLVLGVVFLLYILWGPILEASRKNSKFKSFTFSALVDGYISDVYVEDRVENKQEQANQDGRLEVLEKKRTFVILDIEDEDGYRVTSPEGFVAIKNGTAMKLVDRLEFSRANFTVAKNWG